MSAEEPATFDLVGGSWLLVRDLDGRGREYGVLQTLGRAHELAGLSGDVPTQTFALTRMLLAVLHRALDGPRDDDAWVALWEADRLPVEKIADYLGAHRQRFDLFQPETPFLQVPGLRTAKGETSELSKLVADVPNGTPFFTTRLGGTFDLSYPEAARWLVHCQAWDISGIKSGALGDERVRNGKGYPIGVGWSGLLGGLLLEGDTLKDTLLLNLQADDHAVREPGRDLPAWERLPVTAAEETPGGRAPTGPVDLYTWQSRRIRLLPQEGRVRRVLICNGERLTPQNMDRLEPHTAWRRSEPQEKKLGRSPVYMPREHDPDRAIWRGLQSLLPGATSRQGTEAAPALAPRILEWLGHLGEEEMISDDRSVRVRAVGMRYGSNNSVTDDIVDDTLALRAVLARQDADRLARVAASCAEAAEKASRALGGLAGDLTAAAGGDGGGPRSRAMEQVYARLDGPFRRWLVGLRRDSDTIEAQITWHKRAREIVVSDADEVMRRVPPACWGERAVRGHTLTAAHAVSRFYKDLATALPFAAPIVPTAATAPPNEEDQ